MQPRCEAGKFIRRAQTDGFSRTLCVISRSPSSAIFWVYGRDRIRLSWLIYKVKCRFRSARRMSFYRYICLLCVPNVKTSSLTVPCNALLPWLPWSVPKVIIFSRAKKSLWIMKAEKNATTSMLGSVKSFETSVGHHWDSEIYESYIGSINRWSPYERSRSLGGEILHMDSMHMQL